MTLKAKAMTVKINVWDYIKLKNLTAKEKINKMERQTKEWEKIFVNHLTDKEFIFKIYTELIQQLSDLKMDKDFSRHFFKGQMAMQVHEKVLHIHITNNQRNANQNHNELSPHIWQCCLLSSKRQEITSTGEDIEKRNPQLRVVVGSDNGIAISLLPE